MGTLYKIIPNAPLPSTEPLQPKLGPHFNGVIGSLSYDTMIQLGKMMVSYKTPESASGSQQAPTCSEKFFEVLIVKSMTPKNAQQPGGKKKTKIINLLKRINKYNLLKVWAQVNIIKILNSLAIFGRDII